MDAFKLTKTLKLHETDGWYSVPFIQGTNTSFYTEIIENKSLTIAWVAIQNKIRKKDLQLHHFRRQTSSETGIKNSLPRLLIVTDGKKWFLSKLGSEDFIQAKYSNILIALYNEIKTTIKDVEISKEAIRLQKNLTKTLEKLKTQIRVYGESIQPNKQELPLDLFSGTGQLLLKEQNPSVEYLITSTAVEEIERYSIILHKQLFRRLHPKQIQFLLLHAKKDIFVNPFFRHNQFLVCISKISKDTENDIIIHGLTFVIVDQFADAKEYHPTETFIEQEILPTLLKIDRELVKKYLTNEPF
jgi:hypothetical protein